MPQQVFPVISAEDVQCEGLQPSPQPWEDGLRAPVGRGFFEWWYFDFHFEDGSTAVIVFFTKPILNRNAPLMPGVSLTITPPDGKKQARFGLFPDHTFSASKDTCNVQIGSCRVEGNLQQYELQVKVQGLEAHLVLHSTAPAWRPGAGKNYYDPQRKRYFAWLAAVPHGNVEGTLSYDGKVHAVRGSAYHDHNWGNVGLESVLSHWYWGRAHVGEFTLIFVEMTAARRYANQKLPVFLLAQGDRVITGDGGALRMQTAESLQHPGGRSYPKSVEFLWQSAEASISILLDELQVIEATSLLGALPAWKQRLARLVGANPYYFRFNARMALEIAIPGIQACEQGTALYEIMLLR